MKIISILIILLAIFNYSYCDTFIQVTQFQYDYEKCSTSTSSSSNESSDNLTGYSNLFDRRIGAIDGGGNSGSESSIELLCDNDEIANVVYVLPDVCTSINFNYYIFSIDYSNGKIIKTQYYDGNCSISLNKTKSYQTNECTYDCSEGVYMYEIIQRSDINIPLNSLVSISYNGECFGSWKNSFTSMGYYPINDCSITGPNSSILYWCNKTKAIVTSYSERLDCRVTPIHTDTQLYNIGTAYCDFENLNNQFLICNI